MLESDDPFEEAYLRRRTLLPVAVLILAACHDATSPVPPAPNPEVAGVPGLARSLVSAHRGTLLFNYSAALKGFAAKLSTQAAKDAWLTAPAPRSAAFAPDAAARTGRRPSRR